MKRLFVKFRCSLTFIFFLQTTGIVIAQRPDISVWGTIHEKGTEERLGDTEIFVNQGDGNQLRFPVDSNGYFEFFLEIGELHTLTFHSEDYVKKEVEIHTQEVPEKLILQYSDENNPGWSLRLDLSLFKKSEGFRERVMKHPIGKLHFNQLTENFDVDLEHTAKMKDRIEKELNRLEKRKMRRARKER